MINENECIRVSLIGRLDTVASGEFSIKMDEILASSPNNIEFDCKDLEYVASSGLRIFLNTYKRLNSSGFKLSLTNVRPQIMDILKMTGFTTFLPISE